MNIANHPEPTLATALDFPVSDELVQWELRIAQRADQLARETTYGRDRDLECWLRAEHEVFASAAAESVAGSPSA